MKTANPTSGDGRVRFGGLITPGEQQNAIHVFTEPKEKLEQAFQASWFNTEKRAGNAAMLRYQINLFATTANAEGQKRWETRELLIRDTQSAMCSVEGRSLILALQGITGIIYSNWMSKVSKGLGRFMPKWRSEKEAKEPSE